MPGSVSKKDSDKGQHEREQHPDQPPELPRRVPVHCFHPSGEFLPKPVDLLVQAANMTGRQAV